MKFQLSYAFLIGSMLTQAALAADPPAFVISKETTIITEPLRADGTPDYMAAINARYSKGVTSENNAFVALIQVVGMIPMPDEKTRATLLSHVGIKAEVIPPAYKSYGAYLADKHLDEKAVDAGHSAFFAMHLTLWNDDECADGAAFLKARQKELDAAVKAVDLPNWWLPAVSPDGRTPLLAMPSLGVFREISNNLCCRATQKARRGDFSGAWSDLIAVKKLARHIASGQSLIERLVGVAINSMANESLGAIVGSGLLNVAQSTDLTTRLAQLKPLRSVVEAVDESERWSHLSLLTSMAVHNPSVVDALGEDSPALIKAVGMNIDWNLALKVANASIDHDISVLKSPDIKGLREQGALLDMQLAAWSSQRGKNDSALIRRVDESREAYTTRITRFLEGILTPSLVKAEERSRRGQLQDKMLDLLLLAAASKAKAEKWPASLAELPLASPSDLYPIDNPGTLKYSATSPGARIYSVGENGRDDGGIKDESKNLDDLLVGALPSAR